MRMMNLRGLMARRLVLLIAGSVAIGIAAIYLPYGLSRLLSFALDGLPNSALVSAAIFEIAVGAVCLLALLPGRITHITY